MKSTNMLRNKSVQTGNIAVSLIITATIIIGAFILFKNDEKKSEYFEKPNIVEEKKSVTGDTQVPSAVYSGEVFAGKESLFLGFKKEDYDLAISQGKTILLYFYANWCPICKKEILEVHSAFNELDSEKIVGFRVNYKDNETDKDEEALARQFGVAYQHTKIFLQDGNRILKAPDSWNKERYILEINKILNK